MNLNRGWLKRGLFFVTMFGLGHIPRQGLASTLPFDWHCPQSKISQPRPLPDQASFQIPYQIRDNSVVFQWDALENFFEPARNGNTDYRECLRASFLAFFNRGASDLCGDRLCHDFDDVIAKYQALYETMESDEVRYPTRLSFQSADGNIPEIRTIQDFCTLPPHSFLTEPFLKNHFERYLDQAPRDCRLRVLRESLEILKWNPLPPQCEEQTDHPICQDILSQHESFMNEVLLQLARAEPERFAQSAEELICTGHDFSNPERLLTFIDKVMEAESCTDLEIGQEKRVSTHVLPAARSSAVPGYYNLKRTGENDYQISIHLQITPGLDYDGPFEGREFERHYKARVRSCLDQANQAMHGPGGERLRIVLSDNAPSHPVTIGDRHLRSNSRTYESGIDCATVLHEVLHLMGLVDEYQEVSRGYVMDPETNELRLVDTGAEITAYNCRSVGPSSSVMSAQWIAWDNAFDSKWHQAQQQRPDLRPQGIQTTNSILLPGHVNLLLYPGCREKNGMYYDCSQGAYRTEASLESCPDFDRCHHAFATEALGYTGRTKTGMDEITKVPEPTRPQTIREEGAER